MTARRSSAETAALAIAIREARGRDRNPPRKLKRQLFTASVARRLGMTAAERGVQHAVCSEPFTSASAGVSRRALLGDRIADAMGLP